MSRSISFIVFPEGYDKLLYCNKECHVCGRSGPEPIFARKLNGNVVTGMFDEPVYECYDYFDGLGQLIYREAMQCDPWDSGPNIFMMVVNGDGEPVLFWTDEQIQNALGYSPDYPKVADPVDWGWDGDFEEGRGVVNPEWFDIEPKKLSGADE